MWGDYSHGLQMTRALGDVACAKFLNRVPEVFTIYLGDWLLIGSDGLFDPSHLSGDAYDDVLACIRNGNSAEDLVRQAVALPTRDNVTAILWRRK
jgi:serine/threonine protein phosphatase PrpC